MGYLAPVEYHGVNEKGKDIICFEYDRLNEQRFLAVVAKTGDLTGSASSTMGLMNVVTQVQQAFDNPYENLFNMRQVFINEVWVMTTGKIVSSAQESAIAMYNGVIGPTITEHVGPLSKCNNTGIFLA